MILNELFDRVVPYHFVDKTNAKFEINDKTYQVEFMESFSMGGTEVVFSLEDESLDDEQKYMIQGTGNEILVFSTVLKIINEYVAREKVRRMTFSAHLDEPSRVKLYDRMVKVLAKGWYVQIFKSGGEKHYDLTAHRDPRIEKDQTDVEDVPF